MQFVQIKGSVNINFSLHDDHISLQTVAGGGVRCWRGYPGWSWWELASSLSIEAGGGELLPWTALTGKCRGGGGVYSSVKAGLWVRLTLVTNVF